MDEDKVIQESDLVKVVQDRAESGKHENLDMQTYINLAYYVGQQWIAWDRTSKKLIVPEKAANEVRFVANRTQAIVRTELAKVTKNRPICNVIPASSDDEDTQSAHVGEKACEWLQDYLDLKSADQELVMWGLCGGTSFMKPYWNPNKDVELQPGVKLGNIDCDVVSQFDLLIDPSAKKWNEVKWVIHQKTRTVDYVKEVYGKEVSPEKNISTTNIFDSKLANLNNIGSIEYKSAEDSVVVKEYWEKPSSKYPKGRRITVANDVLLFYVEDIGFGEKDKTERELPFFPFIHILIPGRVWGQSIIEQLIPIQREYNRSRSQIIENKDLVAHPPWVVEADSLVNDIEGGAGEIVEYKKGFTAPRMEQPPSMSSDVYKNIEQCKEEFEFVSGQHETSHGSVPAGVKSGIAINFLQEQDDTKLGPTLANFEKCKENYMSYMLKILRFKYDIPRTINITGKNNKVEAVTFMGSDLTSTDVKVQAGSSLPQSKAAKQEFILNLVERGLLNPQEDKYLILKMLELGYTDDIYDDVAVDINQATGEQDRWRKGDFNTIVRDFHNHMIHLQEHNRFRKSEDYEQLGEAMGAVDEHVMQHVQFMNTAMMNMQQSQMNNQMQAPQQGMM